MRQKMIKKTTTTTISHRQRWITYFWHARTLNCKLHQRHCTFLSFSVYLPLSLVTAIRKYFARNRKAKTDSECTHWVQWVNKLNALAHGACLAFQRCQLQFVHNLNNFAVRGASVCCVCDLIFNNTKNLVGSKAADVLAKTRTGQNWQLVVESFVHCSCQSICQNVAYFVVSNWISQISRNVFLLLLSHTHTHTLARTHTWLVCCACWPTSFGHLIAFGFCFTVALRINANESLNRIHLHTKILHIARISG